MKRILTLFALVMFIALPAVSAIAQGSAPAKTPAATASPKLYVCTMCSYAGDKPGKCPDCGMNLKEVNKADVSYVCDMGCSSSDKPGKCSKCGMTLKMKVAEPKAAPAPNAK